jgi:hypothetical protein
MTSKIVFQHAIDATLEWRPRTGSSSLEVFVAFTLLTTVLAAVTPLVVRHGRLLSGYDDYRLALDELSNQLDRLTALPSTELSAAVSQLRPSGFTSARLPGAQLSGTLAPAEIGQRLTLQISWDEPQRRAAPPLCLAGWVFPERQRPSSQQPAGRAQGGDAS